MSKELNYLFEEDRLFANYRDYGDVESFHRLFAITSPWLLKMIYRITGDMEAAKDLEQDCWFKLIKQKEYFNSGKGRIANLIYTIAKNNALMWKRRLKVEKEYLENFPDEEKKTSEPDKALEKTERSAIIKESIEKLSENHKDVVILFYLADMKIKDIAKVLDKPENTVKTLLRRAKIQLESILSPVFEKEYK